MYGAIVSLISRSNLWQAANNGTILSLPINQRPPLYTKDIEHTELNQISALRLDSSHISLVNIFPKPQNIFLECFIFFIYIFIYFIFFIYNLE